MRPSQCIQCEEFPCDDVNHDGYIIPDIEIQQEDIHIVLISESAPVNSADHYYSEGKSLFEETTVLVFQDAGVKVESVSDILSLGVYMTTAVKCAKVNYGMKAATVKECSHLLEKELDLFPNVRALLLMGDVAIKSCNYIAKRKGFERVIPAGSTYKIRGKPYYYGAVRAYPSYVQAGPSFFIEKSKRKMIAEDIRAAVEQSIQGSDHYNARR